jgi:DNA gyrase/topoisomerase IV subunit A
MIHKSDVQWWVLEAKKHPESAPKIIEELAERLVELDDENERLRNEIIHLQRRTPATATDSAEVSALQHKIDTLQSLLDSETSTEPAVVFLSHQTQSARIPLSQARPLIDAGRPVMGSQALLRMGGLLIARSQDELLLLTSQGRGFKLLPSDAPVITAGADWPAAEGRALAEGERLTAAVAVTEPPRFWTVVTRRGYVRQSLRIRFDRNLAQGDLLVESPIRNDAPAAIVNGDEGDLLLITRWGKGVRFSQRTIESQGSVALELEPDDAVVAALPLPSDTHILIVTAAGFAIRRDTAQLEARSRPGGAGKSLIQAYDVLNVFPYESQARLLYLTYSGKLVSAAMSDTPLHTRYGKGARLRTLDRDPAVAVAILPAS